MQACCEHPQSATGPCRVSGSVARVWVCVVWEAEGGDGPRSLMDSKQQFETSVRATKSSCSTSARASLDRLIVSRLSDKRSDDFIAVELVEQAEDMFMRDFDATWTGQSDSPHQMRLMGLTLSNHRNYRRESARERAMPSCVDGQALEGSAPGRIKGSHPSRTQGLLAPTRAGSQCNITVILHSYPVAKTDSKSVNEAN